MIKKNRKLVSFCTYIFVLLPILGTYGFFSKSITFADIAIIITLIAVLMDSIISRKLKISNKAFFLFVIWCVFSTILASAIYPGLFSKITLIQIIKLLIYSTAIIIIPTRYFDFELAKKVYTRVGIVLSIIVFIQYSIYLINGSFYPWVINSKYFPAIYVNDDYFSGAYLYMLGGSTFRPASIFSEPALFAQFISPCLILNMFSEDNKKKYLILILITLATFLGKSANGIVYIVVIWISFILIKMYLALKNKKFKLKTSLVFLIFILFLLSPILIPKMSNLLFGNEKYSIINRISEIKDVKGETSGSMRIIRGWQIYNKMSFKEKITGIGIGNILNYLDIHPYTVTMFSKSYNGYMSGLSAIFVNFGLIGGLIFLWWLLKQFASKSKVSKSLSIFLLLYLIASNSFLSPQFVITIILVITTFDLEKKINNKTPTNNSVIQNTITYERSN